MFASTWFAVDQRRLAEPPETLWRVEHSGSTDGAVFSSRASPRFHDWSHFSYMKRLHADWRNRDPTPFLSAFANYRHAENWANQRVEEMGDRCVQIHEIDTDGLLVFGAGGDEFLVLDEIPLRQVMHTTSLRLPPAQIGYVGVVNTYSDDTTSSDDSYYDY